MLLHGTVGGWQCRAAQGSPLIPKLPALSSRIRVSPTLPWGRPCSGWGSMGMDPQWLQVLVGEVLPWGWRSQGQQVP